MSTILQQTSSAQHLAHHNLGDEQMQACCEQFHRDGYLFLTDVLPPETAAQLRVELDEALKLETRHGGAGSELHMRMFETSPANLALFDMDPVVSLAEALLGQDCHVFANCSFRTPRAAGFLGWHQDDPPHYLVTHGEPPTNVRLPVLFFGANYYLTDVEGIEHGPTQVIPGSHLFGKPCPKDMTGTPYEKKVVNCLGPAGSVILFNNQLWHRGAPNASDRVRYVAQVSYGRRIIGHKYFPFMNYTMPEYVYKDANPRLKRLLGFLPHGAYG